MISSKALYVHCGMLYLMKTDLQRRTRQCPEGDPSPCPAGMFWHKHRLKKKKKILCILICKWPFRILEVKDCAFVLKYRICKKTFSSSLPLLYSMME